MKPTVIAYGEAVEALRKKCGCLGVNFTLNWNEGNDSWYVCIDSPAPDERFIGKDRTFKYAIECALDFLVTLETT